MRSSILLSLLFLSFSFSSLLQADYTIDKPIDFSTKFTRDQSHNDSPRVNAWIRAAEQLQEEKKRAQEEKERIEKNVQRWIKENDLLPKYLNFEESLRQLKWNLPRFYSFLEELHSPDHDKNYAVRLILDWALSRDNKKENGDTFLVSVWDLLSPRLERKVEWDTKNHIPTLTELNCPRLNEAIANVKQRQKEQKEQKAKDFLISAVIFLLASVPAYILLKKLIKLIIRLMKLPHPYTIIACAILALAFAPMPYGYYNFLHIAVCLYSIYLATTLWHPQQVSYRALLAIAIAILYNPIWRITLTRDSWPAVNAITIILFLTVLRHPLPPKTPS